MENIYNHYRNIVADACLRIDELKIVDHEEVKKSDLLSSSFIVEKPNNEAFGDLSSNIVLISSKFFQKTQYKLLNI